MSLDFDAAAKAFEENVKGKRVDNYNWPRSLADTLPSPRQLIGAYRQCAMDLSADVRKELVNINAVLDAVANDGAELQSLEQGFSTGDWMSEIVPLALWARDIENGIKAPEGSEDRRQAEWSYDRALKTICGIRRGWLDIFGNDTNRRECNHYQYNAREGWYHQLKNYLPRETLAPFPKEPPKAAEIIEPPARRDGFWSDFIRRAAMLPTGDNLPPP